MKKIIPIVLFVIFIIILWPKESEPIITDGFDETIKVEIKGSVSKPGLYEITKGSRVDDIIKLSGGLLENADISVTNLSKTLTDEMVIIIYSKDEISEMKKGSTSIKFIDNECICPKLENDTCIENSITNIEVIENDSGKISLNKATLEELMTIKGIGESKAKLIIEYRSNTPFKSIEEITNVKGIGQATYEKIKDQLSL